MSWGILWRRGRSPVYGRKPKDSNPPHPLGRTAKARQKGAGMAHTKLETTASPGVSCTRTVTHVDIQQQTNHCEKGGHFPLPSTTWVWWVWQFDLKQEKDMQRDSGQLWNESYDQLRRSRKNVFGWKRRVSPARGQVDGRRLGSTPTPAGTEIPWDAQLAREPHTTPNCPRQKPHLFLPSPWGSPPKARRMITFNPFLFSEHVLPHPTTEHSLLGMSMKSLSQRYVTDGPSSRQTTGEDYVKNKEVPVLKQADRVWSSLVKLLNR